MPALRWKKEKDYGGWREMFDDSGKMTDLWKS
jgi:hypothetical protein